MLDFEEWLACLSSESDEEGIQPDFRPPGVKVDVEPGLTVDAGETLSATYSGFNMHAIGAPENTVATATLTLPSGALSQTSSFGDSAEPESVTFAFTVPAYESSGGAVLEMSAAPTATTVTSLLTVRAVEPVRPDPSRPEGTDGELAKTGFDPTPFLVASLLSATAGSALLAASRRSRASCSGAPRSDRETRGFDA